MHFHGIKDKMTRGFEPKPSKDWGVNRSRGEAIQFKDRYPNDTLLFVNKVGEWNLPLAQKKYIRGE